MHALKKYGLFFAATLLMATLAACAGSTGSNSKADAGTGTDRTGTEPTLLSSSPSDGEENVPLNVVITAYFDSEMTPLGEAAYTLKQGGTTVTGIVETSEDGMSATFSPDLLLDLSTGYDVAITTSAESMDGEAFVADALWSFTSGTESDTTAPEIASTTPEGLAESVARNTLISATFTEAMGAGSITGDSFVVTSGSSEVDGVVTYGPGTTAVFTPDSTLASNTTYMVTLSTDITDTQHNPLAADYVWEFTTGSVSAQGPAPVLLGTAGNYVILAKAAVSSVPDSVVTGDIAVSPAAATYITGFSLTADSTNVFSTSPQVTGQIFAANYAVPTPSNLTTAVSNMETAYSDAAGRVNPDFLELGTGNIGGMTLEPGLYKWTSSVTIPANVTLSGGANDVWIFQTTGDLQMSSGKQVFLSGGAQAKNIFWQIAGNVSIGTTAHFEGVILCSTDVTLNTGATMNGRILAQTEVALQQATVTAP